ncbi:NAD-dependent epimerase/dehydratase family protein [Jiangella mangrovi]|uniref:Nucleoside-diphosphate-sugar epimerase n=1 Tax=Jiangella mangrovi TaxID=1524084 RepID=A0A7W9GQ72_9ACTN|nr:NAD(P)-dependent oxidoreductase [Jiangella mangrovi]MBB5787809.1 nucleoside-diphosphate-sugar epimerase [Jiangella mangrovi]
MRIFVAGASGAIGRYLVPELVERGHEVVGTTRTAAKAATLRDLGAEPVVLDALDPEAVADAVAKTEPEVIVHQLTALNGPMRTVKRMAAATNRLRIEGTDHLLAAGRAVGVRTVVAQSNYAPLLPDGGRLLDESARIDPDPPRDIAANVAAIRHLEAAVTGITWGDGIVLRYGGFYGPGTGIETAPDAVMAGLVRRRRFPIIGGGGGLWSMVHITDAASATVAAIERGAPGIYHVADDDPAPVRDILLGLAGALGAKPPRRVPAWLVRPFAGRGAVEIMTRSRAITNEKIERELGWTPRFPSWRTGFVEGMS